MRCSPIPPDSAVACAAAAAVATACAASAVRWSATAASNSLFSSNASNFVFAVSSSLQSSRLHSRSYMRMRFLCRHCRTNRRTWSVVKSVSICSFGAFREKYINPMRKSSTAPHIKSAVFEVQSSAVEDGQFLQRPSVADASGTYPSSHVAHSGPVAYEAHCTMVLLITEHASGLRQGITLVV